MNLVRDPGLLHKMFLTSREISKYVIIMRTLSLSSEIQNDRNYHLWQYHEGESKKPPATKYLDMPTKITNMVLRVQLRSVKEIPETRAG